MIKTIFLKELKININTLKIKSIFYKKKKTKTLPKVYIEIPKKYINRRKFRVEFPLLIFVHPLTHKPNHLHMCVKKC